MSLSLYSIIKRLGNGGFGETFLAINTLLPSRPQCVVKKLMPVSNEPHLQELIQERFEKEGKVLESLGEHSNGLIPRLYAYFREDGDFYLVQEYISGQTLLERVRANGPLPEIKVRQLLSDILPTLTYVHNRGMVHRDIKPENIILREGTNKPVLIDFGAVKETMGTFATLSGNTGRSIVIGTPGYMPAEQVSGRPMFVSDIYALGLTAIYSLTGRNPGDIETDPASGNFIWQCYAPDVSPQMVNILNAATNPIPQARYSSAEEMLRSLSEAFIPSPINPAGGSNGQVSATMVSPDPIAADRFAPTVISDVSSPPPSYIQKQVNLPPEAKSQSSQLMAAVIGVAIGGGLIAAGLVLGKNFTDNSSTKPSSISSPKSEAESTSTLRKKQDSDSQPVTSSNNNNSNSSNNNSNRVNSSNNSAINNSNSNSNNSANSNSSVVTRDAATAVIRQWLSYKNVLLAPPYDKAQGANILYGKAYRDNVDKSSESCSSGDSDDCLSSVDWLKKYDAYYSFGVQRIDSIDRFEANGDTGTIFATITELRTLHKTGGRVTSSGGTKQARYDLKYDGGKVKISDYKVLN
jgi:serine/threonine protein kinase